jgi:hypothetical protein
MSLKPHLFTFVCVIAVGVIGCSETSGTGGAAGNGGSAGMGGQGGAGGRTDPGTGEWELVPRDRVAEECGLDPDLLDAANEALFEAWERPTAGWAVVRYGKLCYESYRDGSDSIQELNATTKTLGAVVTGMVTYQTKDFERTGRKTGPLLDEDRVDHWLDSFDFNPNAKVAHVLAMVATNDDLTFGSRDFIYDVLGGDQIDRLSDITTLAIAQDPENLGENLEVFVQRFLFGPLGMNSSSWNGGAPEKSFGLGWKGTARDMARLGLLILNGGVWSGERLLDEEWIRKITHPAFEDASTSYGYLTWLSSNSNSVGAFSTDRFDGPWEPCTPPAIWPEYPHGLSESPDCNYNLPWTCDQEYDVGAWSASGYNGNHIVGHPGLDMVIVVKTAGTEVNVGFTSVWPAMRPALIALDPTFQGDEEAFCEAYGSGAYAPDLRP